MKDIHLDLTNLALTRYQTIEDERQQRVHALYDERCRTRVTTLYTYLRSFFDHVPEVLPALDRMTQEDHRFMLRLHDTEIVPGEKHDLAFVVLSNLLLGINVQVNTHAPWPAGLVVGWDTYGKEVLKWIRDFTDLGKVLAHNQTSLGFYPSAARVEKFASDIRTCAILTVTLNPDGTVRQGASTTTPGAADVWSSGDEELPG